MHFRSVNLCWGVLSGRRGLGVRVGGLATAGMNPDLDPIPSPLNLGPLSEGPNLRR